MHLRYKFDEGIIAFLKGAPMTLKAEKIVHEIPIPQFSVSFSTVEIEAPPATPIPTAIPVPLLNTTVSYRKPTPVKIGAVQPSVSFTLTGSYFNFASGHLTAKGKKEMANYALFLKQNPNLNITIEGHTDESGSNQNNYQLGMKRAQSVWKELKKSGVQNSMNVTSYGEERPIDPAKTKSAYAKNRRVELRINDGVPLQKERQ
jgi:outer membrane protein OmpA-like peptidoglycan-associated protein